MSHDDSGITVPDTSPVIPRGALEVLNERKKRKIRRMTDELAAIQSQLARIREERDELRGHLKFVTDRLRGAMTHAIIWKWRTGVAQVPFKPTFVDEGTCRIKLDIPRGDREEVEKTDRFHRELRWFLTHVSAEDEDYEDMLIFAYFAAKGTIGPEQMVSTDGNPIKAPKQQFKEPEQQEP